jgi:DNA-3-methyladenine glycosylase II
MFSMFTMRRPNILAPGDLGLQKGLIRWLGYEKPVILPSKLVQPIKTEEPLVEPAVPAEATSDLPDIVLQPAAGTASSGQPAQIHADDFPPAPPFPPSETLTQEKLRARLSKKIKGNIYLSAKEMEELTAAWAPYRSLGLYYMWSLAGESGE